jgi:hypothetical protein
MTAMIFFEITYVWADFSRLVSRCSDVFKVVGCMLLTKGICTAADYQEFHFGNTLGRSNGW